VQTLQLYDIRDIWADQLQPIQPKPFWQPPATDHQNARPSRAVSLRRSYCQPSYLKAFSRSSQSLIKIGPLRCLDIFKTLVYKSLYFVCVFHISFKNVYFCCHIFLLNWSYRFTWGFSNMPFRVFNYAFLFCDVLFYFLKVIYPYTITTQHWGVINYWERFTSRTE